MLWLLAAGSTVGTLQYYSEETCRHKQSGVGRLLDGWDIPYLDGMSV